MSREKFEADLKDVVDRETKKAKWDLQDGYIDEARSMDEDRDRLRVEILAESLALEEKKKRLIEIEGKPEAVVQENRETEKFKTWQRIKLRTGLKTADDFEKALKNACCKMDSGAKRLLKEVEREIASATSQEEEELELVVATPAELDLSKGGTLEEIYAAAKKEGLEKSPREAGPQSAIQYEKNPEDDYGLIGADPVVDSDGNRHVFCVDRRADGKRFLSTGYGYPDSVWFPDIRFVFVRRKKSELKP